MSDVGTDRGQAAMRIVIGGALLGFVLWRFTCEPSAPSEPAEQVEEDFRSLHGKLERYADTYSGLPSSLDRLVKTEEGMPKLLDALPRDPWGGVYSLELDGSSTHYTLHSDGPDTTAGTDDDLQSAGSWVPDP